MRSEVQVLLDPPPSIPAELKACAKAIACNRVRHPVPVRRLWLHGVVCPANHFRSHFLLCGKCGALAQLGEHLLCKQRVIGSIPIGSTKVFAEQIRKYLQGKYARRQDFGATFESESIFSDKTWIRSTSAVCCVCSSDPIG